MTISLMSYKLMSMSWSRWRSWKY